MSLPDFLFLQSYAVCVGPSVYALTKSVRPNRAVITGPHVYLTEACSLALHLLNSPQILNIVSGKNGRNVGDEIELSALSRTRKCALSRTGKTTIFAKYSALTTFT